MLQLAVILPTFNERKNIAPMIERLDAALEGIAWEAIFVDDNSPDGTAEEARRIGKPALEYHAASLNWLRTRLGADSFTKRTGVHRGADLESWEAMGMAIVGSPETVRTKLTEQVHKLGINYLIAYLFFGTMTLKDAMRSQQLFVSEIMPHLAKM